MKTSWSLFFRTQCSRIGRPLCFRNAPPRLPRKPFFQPWQMYYWQHDKPGRRRSRCRRWWRRRRPGSSPCSHQHIAPLHHSQCSAAAPASAVLRPLTTTPTHSSSLRTYTVFEMQTWGPGYSVSPCSLRTPGAQSETPIIWSQCHYNLIRKVGNAYDITKILTQISLKSSQESAAAILI